MLQNENHAHEEGHNTKGLKGVRRAVIGRNLVRYTLCIHSSYFLLAFSDTFISDIDYWTGF